MADKVLTNLDFLKEGQPWPPHSQKARLARYHLNEQKFDNEAAVNKSRYQRIINLIGNDFRVVKYKMLINFYRKVSYKTADLLFVERPQLVAKTEANQAAADEINELSDIGSLGYQAAIDASRFGDCVFFVESSAETQDGEVIEATTPGHVTIISPNKWFPVSFESNVKKIQYHVLAWVVSRIITKNGKEKEQKFLQYQVHEKGKYATGERRIEENGTLGILSIGYGVINTSDEQEIGEQTETETVIDTSLSDFAVVPSHNVVTSNTVFGIDDYKDIYCLVDELQVRLEQIMHVLDKHAEPSLSGPTSALTKNEDTGEYNMKSGNFFARDSKEDPDLEYIVWDGQLEASFKEMEFIIDLLSWITEMGSAMFDRDTGAGSNLSGRALKLLYVNPLTKVARIRNNFDTSIRQAVALSSEVGHGKAFTRQDIEIVWKDGLPDDLVELAEVGVIRTGGKPTDTITAQIMTQDGLSKEAAETKADEITAEDAMAISTIRSGANFPPGGFGGDDQE